MNIYDDLKSRGLVYQVSDEDKVREYFQTQGRKLYCGFDPTAPSLHIGNLVPLLALLRFHRAGHKPIFLMGGGTGMIGDPSGKDEERQLQSRENIEASIARIQRQVERIFENEVRMVNNYDWLAPLTAIELMREVGKHFTVNWMMAKESVKNRLAREDVGISYTEFSYMILQAYDFYHLARKDSCLLQIGGSDQWGNITAGTELIRRKMGHEAYALTFPLITTADGKKFGKSQKGAIYLDSELTSPWEFYQYFVRTDDRDVIRFLHYFTFLSAREIDTLEVALEERPEQRVPQKRLAAEMTLLVHGREELDKIEAASTALYGAGEIRNVDPQTLKAALSEAQSASYASLNDVPDLAQVLVDLELVTSKGQAKKDIKAGGVYVNGERVQDMGYSLSQDDLIGETLVVIRKGKKHYGIVQFG